MNKPNFLKSKQEKETERRILVKKTMRKIEKYVEGLEVQKTKAIESAKKAKLQGSTAQYNLAVNSLKMAMSQQKKAQQMLLTFEITLQMRDLTSMTSSFLDGMTTVSKEMQAITGEMNFNKVQKEFTRAMEGVEKTTDNIDELLDAGEMSFDSLSASTSTVSDEEIDKLINTQAVESENAQDNEIDAKLEELTKSLSGL